MSKCEHCDFDTIRDYAGGCPRCGAPVCCVLCCTREQRDALTARLAEADRRLEAHAVLLNEFAGHVQKAKRERDEARGAMRADDERLRQAAASVGIVAGCDAPAAMADEITTLRQQLTTLRGLLREALSAMRGEGWFSHEESDKWWERVARAVDDK